MSARVEFAFCREDGIQSALLEWIIPFEEWYRRLASDSTSGLRAEPLVTIKAIVRQGCAALLPRSVHQAALLDEVVALFIGDFCDWGPGKGIFTPANESMVSVRHHAALEGRVDAFASAQLARFWRFLLCGRPVARDDSAFPYQLSDQEFRVSFVTATEMAGVRDALQRFRTAHIGRLAEWEAAAVYWAIDAMEQAAQRGVGLLVTVA